MNPISGMGGMNPAELQQMRTSMFQQADGNGDGTLNLDEMKAGLEEKGMSTDRVETMFDKMDIDGNGEVTQAESDQAFEQMKSRMKAMMSSMSGGDGETSDDPVSTLLEILNRSDEEKEEAKSLLQEEQRLDSTNYGQTGALTSSSYKSLINLTA